MIRIHFLCLGFFEFSAPHLREGIIQEHSQREEEGGRGVGSDREGELCPPIVQLSLSVMIKMR